MALELRAACERCGASRVAKGEAFICSFECTFCPDCAEALALVCPKSSGEFVRRPRRNR